MSSSFTNEDMTKNAAIFTDQCVEIFQDYDNYCQETSSRLTDYYEKAKEKLERCIEEKRIAKQSTRRTPLTVIVENKQQPNETEGRSRRNAMHMASQKIFEQSQITLNTKLRRPTTNKASIKLENENSGSSSNDISSPRKNEMPPPLTNKLKKVIKKEKKESIHVERQTRSSSKPETKVNTIVHNTRSKRSNSNIVKQKPIICYDISNSDDEREEGKEQGTVAKEVLAKDQLTVDPVGYELTDTDERSQQSDVADNETDHEQSKTKKRPKKYIKTKKTVSKLKKKKEKIEEQVVEAVSEDSEETVYEDAIEGEKSQLETENIAEKTTVLNVTTTIHPGTSKNTDNLVEFEDVTEMNKTYLKPIEKSKIPQLDKTVTYSAGKNTLNSAMNLTKEPESGEAPPNMRLIAKNVAQNDEKFYTPPPKKNIPISSTKEIYSVEKPQIHSALKLSKWEMQQRKEAEGNSKLKKDALQFKIEEQKRLREDKQRKAQVAREEMQKMKEEKLRVMMAEKQAKFEERRKNEEQIRLAKQKAEEQRHLLAKKKFEEEKRLAEEAAGQIENDQTFMHAYNALNPPPLTEDDCVNSSDEKNKPISQGPTWGRSKQLFHTLRTMAFIPKENIVEKFFGTQVMSPDLKDIFENIDNRMLRRNSSAVWSTPPRYSQMPKF